MTRFVSMFSVDSFTDGFEYQGPFTDYPEWAGQLFITGKLKVAGAELLKVQIGRSSLAVPSDADYVSVSAGQWIMVKDVGRGEIVIAVEELDSLRRHYVPYTAEVDEVDSYFVKGVEGTRVTRTVPVSYSAFQWKGDPCEVPVWLQNLLLTGVVKANNRKLLQAGRQECLPSDWVLHGVGSMGERVMFMTDAEFKKEFETK